MYYQNKFDKLLSILFYVLFQVFKTLMELKIMDI